MSECIGLALEGLGTPSHLARSASLSITADSPLNTHGELVDDAISRGCGTI